MTKRQKTVIYQPVPAEGVPPLLNRDGPLIAALSIKINNNYS
jgi:hypothetical protein